MGFNLQIRIILYINPTTGLPFIHKYTNTTVETIPYKTEEYRVPEKFRKYLYQHGSQFHYYIAPFHSRETETTASGFLHYYPKWEDFVKYNSEYEGGTWCEKDHDEFKKALEWMVSKDDVFTLSWSY
jgi:hypothetical protein